MNAEKSADDEFDRRVTAMLSMVPRGPRRGISPRHGKEILQEEMGQKVPST